MEKLNSTLKAMFLKLIVLVFFVPLSITDPQDLSFTHNGFHSSNLSLDGIAAITSNGLLRLTNDSKQQKAHAFHPNPVTFKSNSSGSAFTFSTTFVFAMLAEPPLRGPGIAFVIAPTRGLPGSLPGLYLGLFNVTTNGNDTNHVLAVELDSLKGSEFEDINDNHVGIDINGLTSVQSAAAAYFENSGNKVTNLTLISGKPMQLWVEYDCVKKQLNVTLAPLNIGKPRVPLLSLTRDLSPIFEDIMYVGFSSSTASFPASNYILGWSYKMNGEAPPLDLSQLPKLPRIGPKKRSKFLSIGVPVISISSAVIAVSCVVYFIRRKRKFAEELEDWELDYGPHRFRYKDLYTATNGFNENELLGSGGFGRVYKGILPISGMEIAVKKVSHETRQGIKVFVAEIVSLGRLRHRNLVTLLGYCRRKREFLLVYEYMPNGSLDKYLYNQPRVILNWRQRFRVIKGVASGLSYLHGEWEQVVIHRDVKASNVLLDSQMNGRLGDFGIARLCDHGTDPQTTDIVGTLGYLAPEHARTGKATAKTDVFSFGAFLLEVATGRRPIEQRAAEDVILVDWVFSCWTKGEILEAKDPNLGTDFEVEEVELVLKLGLLCSNSEPEARPSMRQVVQFLERDIQLPDLSSLGLSSSGLTFAHHEGFDNFVKSYPSSVGSSFLSGGR